MSSYFGKAINPKTQRMETAKFLDDYYGEHQYGVRFADGETYPEEDIDTITSLFEKGRT